MIRWLWVWLMLAGCAEGLTPIPNTTTRVGRPEVVDGTELELKIFTTLDECRARVQPDELELCMPYVDRANGEVRLGFQFRLDSDVFPLPLASEHIKIGHLGRELKNNDTGLHIVRKERLDNFGHQEGLPYLLHAAALRHR